ncbi:hypothetical protein BB560_002926 [Smittium megazygosporum]|uniref:Uncharacterized protein n=1 Tax=Smittium megazygosporum TaxID=133381 RepID=A0A2T9ZDF4_9FUNG|nr:hypothetical protein BB560_002926 [Smittium megazygosporum]
MNDTKLFDTFPFLKVFIKSSNQSERNIRSDSIKVTKRWYYEQLKQEEDQSNKKIKRKYVRVNITYLINEEVPPPIIVTKIDLAKTQFGINLARFGAHFEEVVYDIADKPPGFKSNSNIKFQNKIIKFYLINISEFEVLKISTKSFIAIPLFNLTEGIKAQSSPLRKIVELYVLEIKQDIPPSDDATVIMKVKNLDKIPAFIEIDGASAILEFNNIH